ncbi:MAG TPA: haloacid dehalogenase type II [Burkholderiaceae bacterium]|jgi:2-haloacid dehalogenase|nr:haloacid dehalogenase type II [Burkholderiaceae bacterium]
MTRALSAVLFDLYGTLLDVHSVAARADQLFPGRGAALSQLWRDKQLEYSRLRTMSMRYVPFTQVVEDALQYACEALHLPLDSAGCGMLMHEFTQLTPFSDVVPALQRLIAADLTVGVLTNGDPGQLEDALHGAGLDDYFDVLLSADQARAYKTAPAVYELGPLTLGHPAAELLLVSSNGWDAIGAKWYGYRSYWVNRASAPIERLGGQPDGIGRSLNDAVDFALELYGGGRS